jgi:Tfp pilus assembly protein PilF
VIGRRKSVIRFRFLLGMLACVAFLSIPVESQTEDVRQATGLPIPIGAPVIYGQVTLRGIARNEPKPTIFVTLLMGGAQMDRAQTNDRGYYYFLTNPRDGAALLFEVDGMEVGRVILSSGTGSSVRQDITLDWNTARANEKNPQVISVRDAYAREGSAEIRFEKAMKAMREKRTEDALALFKEIVETDPMDFVAWTELGTLYFGKNKFVDAENAYSKALEKNPKFMVALMNLGKLYLAQEQPTKAVTVFTAAVSVESGSAEAFHYLGESYLQAKLGSKAVIALNEAIRLAPSEKAELHLRLAALYNAAGAKDRAANEYKLFLEKRPTYPDKKKLEKYILDNLK